MAKFEYMERAFSSELRPRARLVLQVLVLHCNKEGECFPSIKTIAAKCGYGISTVKRALDELVEAKLSVLLRLTPHLGSSPPSFCSRPILFHVGLIK